MTLLLEIEFLSGVAVAARGPDSGVPDWPVQPDRIFSALVATWAAQGETPEGAAALEWLEEQPSPHLVVSDAAARTSVTVFVPPNDPRVDRLKHAHGVLPALRGRQARQFGFPASRPDNPIVRIVWPDVAPAPEVVRTLNRLATDTSYIGHSSSLTRCRFVLDPQPFGAAGAREAERTVYPGRLAELRSGFARGQRPLRGSLVQPALDRPRHDAGVFGDRWLMFEYVDVAGRMPDVRASALVAKVFRDALLSGYRRIGLAHAIPEVISGHDHEGKPLRGPHLALVPLPFAGFPFADGHVLGFALVPPRESEILADQTFLAALKEIAPVDAASERRHLTLTTREGTEPASAFSVVLSPTLEASSRSMEPGLYIGPSRVFATVTPIVLDRHLKEGHDRRHEEIKSQIAACCVRAGLPEPSDIVSDKHSSFEGMPSAYPSGHAPKWTRWRLPPALAGRQLIHAVIQFRRPVLGPVILGSGRYVGLGLCRPLDQGQG